LRLSVILLLEENRRRSEEGAVPSGKKGDLSNSSNELIVRISAGDAASGPFSFAARLEKT